MCQQLHGFEQIGVLPLPKKLNSSYEFLEIVHVCMINIYIY